MPDTTLDQAAQLVRNALGDRSTYRMPTKAALAELAEAISSSGRAGLRGIANPEWIAVLCNGDAHDAAGSLINALRPFRAAMDYNLSLSDTPYRREERIETLAILDALAAALEAAIPFLRPLPPPREIEPGWHGIAPGLEHAFRIAMASSNQVAELGTSNDGPVARFVASVVAHLYGEKVAVGTVAKYLRRRAVTR